MAVAIPEGVQDWLDKPVFWHLATVNADGSPQSTPVWVTTDGPHVIVNTAIGRCKDKNMRRDGRVVLSSVDPENAYSFLEIRGTVVDIVEGQAAEDRIDDLAEKYLGQRPYPYRQAGERRVTFVIEPTAIYGWQR